MRKSTGFLLSLCGFFLGILLGFFFAPIRKGIQVVSVNNNGDGNTVAGLPTRQGRERLVCSPSKRIKFPCPPAVLKGKRRFFMGYGVRFSKTTD